MALAWVGLAGVGGCDTPAISEPLRMDASTPVPDDATGGALEFSDGVVLSDIRVRPVGGVVPGARVEVSFERSGPRVSAEQFELALRPPRDAARQVALGGVGAPPVAVPVDPRVRTVRVQGEGTVLGTLELPAPWHPTTAIVTVQRRVGGRPVAVVSGPRRRDGLGVLAVLDVQTQPTHVQASFAAAVVVDGSPNEAVWRDAPRTPLVDSLGGEPVRLGARREDEADWGPTEVAWAWNDTALYVAAWLPDRDLRATFTTRDEPIWKEEVFELFVFGDDRRARYLELQVSPRGVVFDAKFEVYRRGDEAWNSRFEARVAVEGTIEDPSDRDVGWTAELAVPWTEICAETEVECPPSPGTTLRVNAFRLERPRKGATVGLALSPTRVPDFHAPQNAAVLQLVR